MLKLVRDWMEKFSAGSFLVAVYQGAADGKGILAAALGMLAFGLALYPAKRGVK
jgi:hypothetical protein